MSNRIAGATVRRKDLMLRGATLRVLMALCRDDVGASVSSEDCSELVIRCRIGEDDFELLVRAAQPEIVAETER